MRHAESPYDFLNARHPWQWVQFGWLCLTDARFRGRRNKRKAYFEYLMVKSYRVWFC